MRFLVTGDGGFIGSHLCAELVNRGHFVICIDNFETGKFENLERYSISKNPKNNLVDLDLNDVHCELGKNIELNIISLSIVPISDAMLFLVLFVLMTFKLYQKLKKETRIMIKMCFPLHLEHV